MQATRALHKRILLTFDFDLTLAPATTDTLLDVLGIDREKWRRDRVDPLTSDHWDQILAHGFALIEAARDAGRPLDSSVMREAAARIEPYPGVPEMFGRLRQAAGAVAKGIELEFNVLSSGFADLIIQASIAPEFARIWASSFHFDENGVVKFIKRTITHPEKARYLEALAKGIGPEGPNAPAQVAAPVAESEYRAPYDQMIYVGDGASDLQAFRFLEQHGGIAIAIEKDGDFAAREKMSDGERVENVAAPDFSQGSELLRSLTLAVQSAAARIELRRSGQ